MNDENIVLLLAGDVHLGTEPADIDPAVIEMGKQSDLFICNLETPFLDLPDDEELYLTKDRFRLRSGGSNANALAMLSVDGVCLANNHICDWGDRGVETTVALLDAMGIAWSGVGRSQEQARQLKIFNAKGTKIGFVSFMEKSIDSKVVSEGEFNCALIEDPAVPLFIEQCKEQVDILVVALHWGYTNYHFPRPEQAALAKHLMERGADVIMGHHPHVAQGVVEIGEKVAFFSLGNFYFSRYLRFGKKMVPGGENEYGMAVKINISNKRVQDYHLVHTRNLVLENRISLLSGKEEKKRNAKVRNLGRPLMSVNYGIFFKLYIVYRMMRRVIYWSTPSRWRMLNKGHLSSMQVALRELVGLRANRKG